MPHTYWIVWAVDERKPFRSRKYPGKWCTYINGIVTPIDPKKVRAFSYVAWTRVSCASPWTYDRREAERCPSLAAARALRRFVWLSWGQHHERASDHYKITRVTVRPRGTLTNSKPEG
jgi:hypothetical protein